MSDLDNYLAARALIAGSDRLLDRQEEEHPMTEADRLRDEQLHVDWNQGGALDRYHELDRQIGAALQTGPGTPTRVLGDHCGACFDPDCDGGHQFRDPQRDQADREAGS